MKPIEALADGRHVHYFPSVIAAERAGYCRQAVHECLKGNRKHHRGYQWRYASPAAKLGEFIAARCCSDDRRCRVVIPILYKRFVDSLPAHEREQVDMQDICEFARARYGVERTTLYDFVRGLYWSDGGKNTL